MVLDWLATALKYGVIGAATIGVFSACVLLLIPPVLLVANIVGGFLNIGGSKDV